MRSTIFAADHADSERLSFDYPQIDAHRKEDASVNPFAKAD